MKVWRIELVNSPSGSKNKKPFMDILTVGELRSVAKTDPESFKDLLRLIKEALQ
jgi:hypothetical protein